MPQDKWIVIGTPTGTETGTQRNPYRVSVLETTATLIPVGEYLEGERTSEVRHEYVAGDVYATAGASRTHNLLAGNIHTALNNLFRADAAKLSSPT